jgi:hypothetical protein
VTIGQTIRSYIWWTHPRGGFHYDVMVTVILAFIFLTPPTVFKDRTPARWPRPGQVMIAADGQNGIICELPASAVSSSESDMQSALQRVIEPAAGQVQITRYQQVRDGSGKVIGYRVWAHRS